MRKAKCCSGNSTETVWGHNFISDLAPLLCNHFIWKMKRLDQLVFKAYSPTHADYAEVCIIQLLQEGLVPNQQMEEDVTDIPHEKGEKLRDTGHYFPNFLYPKCIVVSGTAIKIKNMINSS